MRRLVTISGVGPITAAAIKALVPDPVGFKSGRHFAAWLGLTPRSHSNGGKERLGGISKMGNLELRSLLVLGASSVLRRVRGNDKAPRWLCALLARQPYKVVAVAQQDGAGHMGAFDQGRDISGPGAGERRSERLNRKSAKTN